MAGSSGSRPGAATVAFGGWLVVAGVVLLWMGRGMWTASDDWMLVGPRAWSDPASLLRDHNQHFSLVPVVIYKVMFLLVGFTDYWPYRVLSVLIHLAVVVLVCAIMKRIGVSGWVAMICASVLALYNGGSLVVAQFQMPLALALSLGVVLAAMVTHTLLWSKVIGSALACLAVATSGIAIPVLAAAAVIAWRRRSLATAALLVGPASAVYLAWFLWDSPFGSQPEGWKPSIAGAFAWLVVGMQEVARTIAGGSVLALILVVAVIAGLVRAVRSRDVRLLEPFVLAGAAGVVLLLAYLGRGDDPEAVYQSRFMYIASALLLPVVAVGAQGLVSRGMQWGLLIAVPLLVGLTVNVQQLSEEVDLNRKFQNVQRVLVAGMLRSPAGADTPAWVRPWWSTVYWGVGDTTWGFLRDAYAQGRLDLDDIDVPPAQQAAALISLRMPQLGGSPSGACIPHAQPVRRTVAPGTRIGFRGGNSEPDRSTIGVSRAGVPGAHYYWSDATGDTILVVGDDPETGEPLEVEFAAGSPGTTFYLCD